MTPYVCRKYRVASSSGIIHSYTRELLNTGGPAYSFVKNGSYKATLNKTIIIVAPLKAGCNRLRISVWAIRSILPEALRIVLHIYSAQQAPLKIPLTTPRLSSSAKPEVASKIVQGTNSVGYYH